MPRGAARLGAASGLSMLLALALLGCSGGQGGGGAAAGTSAASSSPSSAGAGSSGSGGPQGTLGPVSHGTYPELDAAAAALGGAWSRPEVRIHTACAEGAAEGVRTLAISRPQGDEPSVEEAAAAFAAAGLGSATPRGVAEGAVAIPAESDGVVEYGTFEGRGGLVYVSRCDTVVG
ncbi:hypothetical protein USB125703_00662 [Pseudoclavibacter triregionum]|nr:hypothetical protein USB125703_00662 [Pseudoclavibacter triregionum]